MMPRIFSSDARAALVLGLALALAGCGDDDVAPTTDGGPRADAHLPDGGPPPDLERPRVIEITPGDGSLDVARSTAVTIRFSEPIGTEGTTRVSIEGAETDAYEATLEGDTLTIEPSEAWPAASEVEVRLDDDFEDEAGNALERPFVARFVTSDDAAPTVVESSPAEGATDVSVRATALRIRFSEPMDQAAGSVTIEGGTASIDATAPSWSASEVTYALAGLEHGATYRVVLDGFRDREGNALDGTVLLTDAAIDFTTRADDEAPRALSSTPFEGQVDVSPSELGGVVEIVFDEPMDTSLTSTELSVFGGSSDDVTIAWTDDRTARIDVRGAVSLDAAHSIDLRGLRDLAGNLLAPGPYLGDGRLDFTTGEDSFVPFVVASSPTEGQTGVANPLASVRLAFSEAMDTDLDEVVVTDSLGNTATVAGTWESAGTVLVVPGTAFVQGRNYDVDVRGLRDRSGTEVSAAHPYLGDGILDFALAAPTGASCAEPLLMENAADFTVSSVTYRGFVIRSAQRTRNNGSGSCDADGIAETDAVVFYRKTSPALGDPSGEGRALRIRTFDVTNRANVEIFSGVCDPRDPAASAARVRCSTYHDDWNMGVDLPPGDYYIWLSTAAGSPFDIRVAIDEVEALAEGQTCETAYTSASAIYTAPATPADPHVFDMPVSLGPSVDIADSNGPFEGISCVERHSDDTVLTYQKVGEDTVLDIFVQPGSTISAEVIAGGCRPDEPGTTRAVCHSGITSASGRRFTARAPAGPVSLWLGRDTSSQPIPATRVEIRELPAPTAPGSSCASAIPITPGASVPVTPDHAARYDGPTCFPESASVTWYSFQTTEELTHVTANGGGGLAVVDAASGRQVGCDSDASPPSAPLYYFAPVGTTVCVAVETGGTISALSIEPIDYAGVGVTGAARLPIARPSLDDTTLFGITGETYLRLTPTRLYQNAGTAAIVEAPRGTGTAFLREDVDGRVMGNGAVTIGEQLFTLDTNSSTTRLFRLADVTGVWDPTTWDRGATAAYGGNTYVLATDGTYLWSMDNKSRTTASRAANVYRWSATTPGLPVVAGQIDPSVYSIGGLVTDGTYFWIAGTTGEDTATDYDGIWRVRIADLVDGTPAPVEEIAALDISTTHTPMVLDDPASPRYLYVRSGAGDIHVFESPRAASPRYLGMIFDGESGDNGMDYDRATGEMYFFSTREDPLGAWYRMTR